MFYRTWINALSRAHFPKLLSGELTHYCITLGTCLPGPPVQFCLLPSCVAGLTEGSKEYQWMCFCTWKWFNIRLKKDFRWGQGHVALVGPSFPETDLPHTYYVPLIQLTLIRHLLCAEYSSSHFVSVVQSLRMWSLG